MPTLAERFVGAFRLPYPIGCLFVGFFLFGIVDVALGAFVQTSNLSTTVAKTLAPASLLTDLLVAYSFYAPRYMRRKLVETGRALSSLLPDRDGEFRRIFAEVASPRPQVIAWVLFLVVKLMNRLMRAEAAKPAGPTKQEELLMEIRDTLKAQTK